MVRIGLTSPRSQSECFDPQLNYIGKSPKGFVAQPEETLSTKLAISSGCFFPRLHVAATIAYASHDDIIISLSVLLLRRNSFFPIDSRNPSAPCLNGF